MSYIDEYHLGGNRPDGLGESDSRCAQPLQPEAQISNGKQAQQSTPNNAKRKVHYARTCNLILIPTRQEYIDASIDLWYTRTTFDMAKLQASKEIRELMLKHPSLTFEKAVLILYQPQPHDDDEFDTVFTSSSACDDSPMKRVRGLSMTTSASDSSVGSGGISRSSSSSSSSSSSRSASCGDDFRFDDDMEEDTTDRFQGFEV